MAYLPDSNALWVFSGSMACPSGGAVVDNWIYRLSSSTWAKKAYMFADTTTAASGAPISDYDPVNKRMLVNNYSYFRSWSPATNTWTALGTGTGLSDLYNGVYVPSRKRLYMIGGDGTTPAAYMWDVSGTAVESTSTTYGDTAIAKNQVSGSRLRPGV